MNNKGFTLIELIVVTAIIVLLLGLALPSYRSANKSLALQRAIHKLAQDLRRAQEMAMSATEVEVEGEGVVPEGGYGLYLNINQPNQYILFADFDANQEYTDENEKVDKIELEGEVEISDFRPIDAVGDDLSIVFLPPDPIIILSPDFDLALINLKTKGLTMQTTQTIYNRVCCVSIFGFCVRWDCNEWRTPRADADTVAYPCDFDQNSLECSSYFTASELLDKEPTVYDQYRIWLIFFWQERSRKFSKQEGGVVTVPLQKQILINKAGLIAIVEE